MKKSISTISILTILFFTNSCRAQEEDLETNNQEQPTNIFKRINDSIKTDSTAIVTTPIPADPPPKNGHQW